MKEFSFDIDDGTGRLEFDDGTPIELEELEEAAREAGFVLERTGLELQGHLALVEAGAGELLPVLDVPSTGQAIHLTASDEGTSRRVLREVRQALRRGRVLVRVVGRARAHEALGLELLVEEFAVVAEPPTEDR